MEYSFGLDESCPAGKEGSLSIVLYGLTPVPGKAVDKILAGDFIVFSELLSDNVELMCRDGERDRSAGWHTAWSPIRRLTSLLSWVHGIFRGGAVGAPGSLDTADGVPTGTCARSADREHRYDHQFRMQAGAYYSDAWMSLQRGIFNSTFWSNKHAETPVVCDYCLEADHATEECALAPAVDGVYRAPKAKPPKAKKGASSKVCSFFNFGKESCTYGADCVFLQTCAKCGGDGHKASTCKLPTAARAVSVSGGKRRCRICVSFVFFVLGCVSSRGKRCVGRDDCRVVGGLVDSRMFAVTPLTCLLPVMAVYFGRAIRRGVNSLLCA